MSLIRPSVSSDIPALRELWRLAFGDDGAYVDNFFNTYYRPERVLVLEAEGAVRAMTAWFDTTFVVPGQGTYRAAYLYAVATHPQWRSRGLSGQLLGWADTYFQSQGISAVTTVPAQPSLHKFFGANGFRECFVHGQYTRHGNETVPEGTRVELALTKLTPEQYAARREERLEGTAHVALGEAELAYQAGACALTEAGGLYAVQSGAGWGILCAEGMENGQLLIKELLVPDPLRPAILEELPQLLPNWSGIYRIPEGKFPFGMLKWLDAQMEETWNWDSTAYLGLAFD